MPSERAEKSAWSAWRVAGLLESGKAAQRQKREASSIFKFPKRDPRWEVDIEAGPHGIWHMATN